MGNNFENGRQVHSKIPMWKPPENKTKWNFFFFLRIEKILSLDYKCFIGNPILTGLRNNSVESGLYGVERGFLLEVCLCLKAG